ncbi:hypothetical protein F5Y01DRAFT_294104 [Xylaria sp. FL0043]|nr:hypothetical protein F5Y01DRAFT_294104 [Xylaria sp. FL0043]
MNQSEIRSITRRVPKHLSPAVSLPSSSTPIPILIATFISRRTEINMATYQTTEQFTCGHTQATVDSSSSMSRRTGRDQDLFYTRKITEAVPIPTRCLTCICERLLEASYSGTRTIPRNYLRELNEHVRLLSLSASEVMQRELGMLGKQVQRLDDIDEFRRGVLALAGYAQVSAHFGL